MKKTSSFLFVLLLVVAHVAQAQTAVSTAYAFERFMITAKGGGWTTGGNAAGQSVAMGPAVLTKAFSEASAATVTPLAGGGATVGLSMGSSAAGSVLATSQAVLTGAAILGTAKAILGGPVGIGMTALMLVPALVDWFTTDTTRPGNPSTWATDKPFEKLKTGCTTCLEYKVGGGGNYGQQWMPDVASATASYCSARGKSGCNWVAAQGGPSCAYPSPDQSCYLHYYDGAERSFGQVGWGSQVAPPVAPIWEAASIDDIRAKMETEPVQKPIIDALLQTAMDRPDLKVKGVPLSSPSNVAVVPLSIPDAAVVTVTKADGKTTTKTDQKITTLSPSVGVDADGKPVQTVTATTKTQSTTKVVDDATGATISESTTATDTPTANPAPLDLITCGLPGTPPCKIDETGTPTGVGTSFDGSKTDLETQKTATATAITGAASITAPAWTFSFALPTGCAPYATGLRGFIMNICPYQPIIHDLLSMVWAATTAFAMIGMVGRTIRSA